MNTLADKIERYFKKQRFHKKHHLGLGDIRLTIAQQEEIIKMANGGGAVSSRYKKYPFACFAIWGKSGMYVDEICVCEDIEPLEDMLQGLREDNPDEDYKVIPLFAHLTRRA